MAAIPKDWVFLWRQVMLQQSESRFMRTSSGMFLLELAKFALPAPLRRPPAPRRANIPPGRLGEHGAQGAVVHDVLARGGLAGQLQLALDDVERREPVA